MTDVEPVVTDFAASGRAGRRNALPDILGSSAGAGTSDLPHKLAELSMSEGEGAEGGEASSSGVTTMENQETEGKTMDS
ncbi:cAMP-dependent protein kinase inhibitor beta [Sceloporus undulatus]|uniref:cAMP-dependent protein kinase inhibitor beta n=1 Tax=Sceloporus undulatus TaxID=8520 RepID=UPI001C4B87B0|nr:cAMP-dependent protein kinase inhibitor beta [Sceloporus undulatus]XP_042302092.1 cAMP-dependent protein kinase inhibitor beta [Sceloporus undulatus]XP_042302093.1 cAMP-dependent protein kinase inhibitor beta [Sceloporus undulatus]